MSENFQSRIESIQHWLALHRKRIMEDWAAFLRFPSISADPAHAADCVACAEWVCGYLSELGFKAELLPTGSAPAVLAEHPGRSCGGAAQSVLCYGHYDVQPVDPLAAWDSAPFEPVLRDGRLFARGAQDNKGQLFAMVQALSYLMESAAPMPPLRVLIDGEEECGSEGLNRKLAEWEPRLQADVLMVCDTNGGCDGRPAITAGLRGIMHFDLVVQGPRRDLHSGMHGGVAPNPALGLSRMLASLHDDGGRIAVSGFLDGICPPSAREQALLRASEWDADVYVRETGVAPVGGERKRPALERRGFQPTIEVNGLFGGYGGKGTKTIIPASVGAKISCRLCPGQDPARSLAALKAHLTAHCPPGLNASIQHECLAGAGFRLPMDTPLCDAARTVLAAVDPRGSALIWEGASIPVIERLRAISGAAPLLVGFGVEADNVHAPNESFALEAFQKGIVYAALMVSSLT